MYRRNTQGWAKHLDFILLDLICLQAAFLAAYLIRSGMHLPYVRPLYRSMAIVLAVIDIGVLIFFDTMKNVLKRGYGREIAVTVQHVLIVILIAVLYLFYTKTGAEYSRLTMFYMGICYLVLTYLVRLLWKRRLKKRMRLGRTGSLLIVTTAENVLTVIRDIRTCNYKALTIIGIAVIDKDLCGQSIQGIPVVANLQTVTEYVCHEWVDEVLIHLPDGQPYPVALLNSFAEMGVVVHMKLLGVSELIGEKRFIERFGPYTVITTSINYVTGRQAFYKRCLDIVGGLVGCAITLLLIVILGPLICLESPGPLFFSQIRVGKNGKKFRLYKFRSMYLDAEERKAELMKENRVGDGLMFKLDWDPRIIGSRKLADGTVKKGIGNVIRDWSLDEFPQFFNVLRGDMSLVGTRPPTLDEWERYDLHHRARLAIKPGVTGLWQVSGRSNITDFEDVVRLDKKYIAEWSMSLDFKILLKTVLVVFRRDGAM